LRMT